MDNDSAEQLKLFTGGQDVKAIDLSLALMRHPKKKYKTREHSRINKIVVHCTDRDWTIEQLNQYDVDGYIIDDNGTETNHIDPTGLPAITYHDVVMQDGKLYHTLPYTEISWHAGGYNSGSIAVSLMFRVTDILTGKDTFAPTPKALKSLQCHLGRLCLKFGLVPDRIFGHRELKGTGWFLNKYGSKRLRKTCPGMQVDLDELRHNVACYMQIMFKLKGLYNGTIDGVWGPMSQRAMVLLQKG